MNVSIYRCSFVVDQTGVSLITTSMAIYDEFELWLWILESFAFMWHQAHDGFE